MPHEPTWGIISKLCLLWNWRLIVPPLSWRQESNPQQAHYKCAALPIELRQHAVAAGIEPAMQESKSCALPLGDATLSERRPCPKAVASRSCELTLFLLLAAYALTAPVRLFLTRASFETGENFDQRYLLLLSISAWWPQLQKQLQSRFSQTNGAWGVFWPYFLFQLFGWEFVHLKTRGAFLIKKHTVVQSFLKYAYFQSLLSGGCPQKQPPWEKLICNRPPAPCGACLPCSRRTHQALHSRGSWM